VILSWKIALAALGLLIFRNNFSNSAPAPASGAPSPSGGLPVPSFKGIGYGQNPTTETSPIPLVGGSPLVPAFGGIPEQANPRINTPENSNINGCKSNGFGVCLNVESISVINPSGLPILSGGGGGGTNLGGGGPSGGGTDQGSQGNSGGNPGRPGTVFY